MYAKSIFRSKTFWANLLTALAALLVELADVPDLGVDPKWVVIALAVVNVALRSITTQPVTLSKPADPVDRRHL